MMSARMICVWKVSILVLWRIYSFSVLLLTYDIGMHDLRSENKHLGILANVLTFCTVVPVMFPLSVFHALHAQYIFHTDPLSSGAAFHAAQVHPDE